MWDVGRGQDMVNRFDLWHLVKTWASWMSGWGLSTLSCRPPRAVEGFWAGREVEFKGNNMAKVQIISWRREWMELGQAAIKFLSEGLAWDRTQKVFQYFRFQIVTGSIYMKCGTLYKLMLAGLSGDMAPSSHPTPEAYSNLSLWLVQEHWRVLTTANGS